VACGCSAQSMLGESLIATSADTVVSSRNRGITGSGWKLCLCRPLSHRDFLLEVEQETAGPGKAKPLCVKCPVSSVGGH
jgi:hypothetical protein